MNWFIFFPFAFDYQKNSQKIKILLVRPWMEDIFPHDRNISLEKLLSLSQKKIEHSRTLGTCAQSDKTRNALQNYLDFFH